MTAHAPRWSWLVVALAAVLAGGCGGGGAGGGAVANPPPPPPPAPPGGDTNAPPVAYAEAEQIVAFITDVDIPADGRPVVDFQVSDEKNTAILNVTAADVRFIIAKHQASPLGNFHGTWQSYINRIEQPGVGPGTAARLQATAERGSSGTLLNNGDGTYRYRFAAAVTTPSAAVATQAAAEGLDLGYDPDLVHRVSIQFDNARTAANPSYDFEPSSGAVDQIVRGLIVTRASCNGCHGELAAHGGARIETDYCVTCHNPGSGDANSGNSVAFAEMIHKIHRGAGLPSVQAGGSYGIYGFGDELADFSTVHYPQDIRHCTGCHSGSATEDGRSVPTPEGDNWTEFPTRQACGACHDDLDFATHFGGQRDDADCRSCHSAAGAAGSIAASHATPVEDASTRFEYEIVSVTGTAPGAFPVVDFRVVDPTRSDAPYDIKSDAPFVEGGGASTLNVTFAWSTLDYTNTRGGVTNASSVSVNALTASTALPNRVFRVTSPEAIPDGSTAPFVAATGSGAVTVEGHPAADVDAATAGAERIAVRTAVRYFSIDEAGGATVPRRGVATIGQCNACHSQLALHGSNRADNIEGCVTCHNPRNTDRGSREVAVTPPTDGKQEESLDFKTMVHGIHGAGVRENPLQIVGFQGRTTYVFDESAVHYPGRLSNCRTCHAEGTFELPLTAGVLGTTVDTGADRADPSDDTVSAPISAVCVSCHDGAPARAHMETNGGDFATTQAFLDSGLTVEGCVTCHGAGSEVDVATVHDVH